MFNKHVEDKLAIIMRGLPGSGKSYWAKEFATAYAQDDNGGQPDKQCSIFSTDHYFYNEGAYQFNPKLLSRYHQLNLTAFIEAMAEGVSIVICDNTNLQHWEYQAYCAAALALGYKVQVELVGQPKNLVHQQLCAQRNQHSVPLVSIKRMAANFEC